MILEDELEVGEISRRLLSPGKKSGRPNLSNFYNDSNNMDIYKYKLPIYWLDIYLVHFMIIYKLCFAENKSS